MLLKDPYNFEAGSFYLMKNAKMIMLVQVLERADGFVVFTVKCSELQETTICHAQENEHINEVISKVFNPDSSKRSIDPQILFSLSPIRQVNFALYDDIKYKLVGIITDSNFHEMTQKYFMAILAYRLAKIFQRNPSTQMVKISDQDLNQDDMRRASKVIEDDWLQHVGLADHQFTYHDMRQEVQKAGQQATGGLSFLDQINQSNGPMQNDTTSAINAQKVGSPLTGISVNRDNEGTSKYIKTMFLT